MVENISPVGSISVGPEAGLFKLIPLRSAVDLTLEEQDQRHLNSDEDRLAAVAATIRHHDPDPTVINDRWLNSPKRPRRLHHR